MEASWGAAFNWKGLIDLEDDLWCGVQAPLSLSLPSSIPMRDANWIPPPRRANIELNWSGWPWFDRGKRDFQIFLWRIISYCFAFIHRSDFLHLYHPFIPNFKQYRGYRLIIIISKINSYWKLVPREIVSTINKIETGLHRSVSVLGQPRIEANRSKWGCSARRSKRGRGWRGRGRVWNGGPLYPLFISLITRSCSRAVTLAVCARWNK